PDPRSAHERVRRRPDLPPHDELPAARRPRIGDDRCRAAQRERGGLPDPRRPDRDADAGARRDHRRPPSPRGPPRPRREAGLLRDPPRQAALGRAVAPDVTDRRSATAIAIALLTLLNILNYVDRSVLFAVQPLIQDEFHVSNARLGALTSVFLIC